MLGTEGYFYDFMILKLFYEYFAMFLKNFVLRIIENIIKLVK